MVLVSSMVDEARSEPPRHGGTLHRLDRLAEWLHAALGSIPVFGDVFDLAWKANRRNVDLLRSWLADPR